MNARAAPSLAAALGLALVGAGSSHALSLRGSATEVFLGDLSPGAKADAARPPGAKLRVENTGRDPVRVECRAVAPPPGGLADGYEPWPYPDRVRIATSREMLQPGESAEVALAVRVPDEADGLGGQYQFDVLETGIDPGGASLTLKTRVLLSLGPPLPERDAEADRSVERPGFALSPPSSTAGNAPLGASPGGPGVEATVKIVNASDEELAVTLSPAREWDESVRIREGYEPAPNPRWLRVEPKSVALRAGAIGRARIGVSIPRQARYAGRHWAFVVAVDARAHGRRTRRYFVLHVDTERFEEEKRVR